MKILFITQLSETNNYNDNLINDIISDMTLHGLKEVHGDNLIDYPGAWYMYKDEVVKKNYDIKKLWGNGFTYYNLLDNYNSIDRSDIKNKIKKNYFEFIIYGAFEKSKLYFEESLNSNSKIIIIDGRDTNQFNKIVENNKIIYFKRELTKNNFRNVFPINVSIPSKKIKDHVNKNPNNLLAPLIPYRYKTYVYKDENEYYQMWRDSLFGITYKPPWGHWWESVKYYEMMMNGCIPLFVGLKNCPEQTLTLFPKKNLLNIFNKYSWILNQYFPSKIYRKELLTYKNFALYFKNVFKKKMNIKNFLDQNPDIISIRSNLINYTKEYLTTNYTAKYIINTSQDFYNSKK